MDDDQSSVCPDCGENHGILAVIGMTVPAVPGSRMRHGGTFTANNGLKIGSGEWHKVRCGFCGSEAMTPTEVIPPFVHQTPDGAYLGHCSSCDYDLRAGFRPGHNPNRARRRKR